MELTAEQIDLIRQDIEEKGITMTDLADSLLDHLCCAVESELGSDFPDAYARALSAFGKEGLNTVQQQTISLLTLKKELTMKKTMYLLGYIAALLSTTGLLFKLMHWPGAAPMFIIGIILLNLGFLPMYFYDRYKRAVS